MPGVAYTLSDLALNGLLACDGADFRRVVAAFEQLALDANAPGVFALRDGANRPLHQLRTGRFVILFYPRIADLPPYIVDLVELRDHSPFR